jgi:hypothetical protein
MKRIYYFPKIRKYVENSIRKCDIYQRNKSAKYVPYGKIMPNRVLREVWQDMTLDFVTKLPLFKKLMIKVIYDSIMIVINRLTKYTYFISYFKSFLTEDLAYIFHKYIVTNHRFS